MEANKVISWMALVFGSLGMARAWAHPGHEHSQGILGSLLHAAQTEWLPPVLVLVLFVVVGYFYLRNTDRE